MAMIEYSFRGAICPECKCDNPLPSNSNNFSECAMTWIGLCPLCCRECNLQFWQVRLRVWLISFVLILGIVVLPAIVSQTTSPFSSIINDFLFDGALIVDQR
jgi:hypothetical protein